MAAASQGPWRRQPWPERKYEKLDCNVAAEDCSFDRDVDLILGKLVTDKKPGGGRQEDKELDVRNYQHFGWTTLKTPAPMVEGEDFEIRPCWGLDCYTRKNLFEVRTAAAAGDESVVTALTGGLACLLPRLFAGAQGWCPPVLARPRRLRL